MWVSSSRSTSRFQRGGIYRFSDGKTWGVPDPYYPDYPSGPALAGAQLQTVPLRPGRAAQWPARR